MSRWSECRGQIEPLGAIAAVLLVGAGLAVYAGALDTRLGGRTHDGVADATLGMIEQSVERNGVVHPDRFDAVRAAGPAGYTVNATLETATQCWHVGPSAPPSAATASERVSVHLDAGDIAPGRLEVRVWS